MQRRGRTMEYWGKHLIIDAKGCDLTKVTDTEYIKDFTKELVVEIDMIPHGEPQLVHFAEGSDKAGWTVIQLIQTSSIIGHFLDHNGDLYLDVFSCKEYEEETVVNLLKSWFRPEEVHSRIIMRDARK